MQTNDSLEILLHGVENFQKEMIDWNDYRIGYFLAKNKGKSSTNEDSVFLSSDGKNLVFGVSDGAGGHPKGSEAAFLTAKNVVDVYKKEANKNVDFINLVEKINDEILNLKVGARCTLALGFITDHQFRSLSVGDSEVIYWNGIGGELYSNIPQSEVGYQIEAGVLEQDESLDDPDRYIVNNLLGDKSVRIEVSSKMSCKKGHTILIGSDGLFDNLSHDQLTEIVGKGSFEKSFDELSEICIVQDEKSWKKDDDISFVMIRKVKA